jgi:formylmethanofuran dehydrogenase subunit B
MTDRPVKIELNCTTGEETITPLTDEEISQAVADQEAHEARRAQEEADAQAKAELKTSAKTKLMAGLPLTAEEADVLVI